jgi:signal transduction histidine kinase
MLLRLLLSRLFLPSLVVTLLAVGLTAYVRGRTLEAQQLLLARSLAQTADDYLEHAIRVLGTMAQVAETSTSEELAPYMQATWQTYGYFDILYWLDESGTIIQLAPLDHCYQGLDMLGQPYFQQVGAQSDVTIFPPFTSLHTGQPTVHIVWSLTDGGMMVGELNLEELQQTITAGGDEQYFIADRSGTLLAHPQSDRVTQQTNVSNMKIVQLGLADEATLLYAADGTFVLGSATQVKSTGWVVVTQTPLIIAYGPYVGAVGLTLILAPVVWLAMILHFRRQLKHHVVAPLARLSERTTALAAGDFAQGAVLATTPAAFVEVGTLATDFERMRQAIQARQGALQRAHRELAARAAELEAANTELSQYASVVSHDLKTPLRAVHNYADFLREDLEATLDDNQKAYLDGLDRAIHEAEELVEDLLELSRVGRQGVPVETVDVGTFLRELIAILSLPADVEIVIPDDWPTIVVEPVLLGRIFQNLIGNAVKFNTSPHKRVELGWRPVTPDLTGLGKPVRSQWYEFFVRDNGIGIDPRYHEQIFRVFERLHTHEEYEGTGIGLAIVKKAASKLGGSVRVESEPGKGSTFLVTLPRTQKERRI